MGLLSTLLFNPVTILGGVYYFSVRSSVSLPRQARLLGVGVGRMVSFVRSQRRQVAKIVQENAAVLEPYLQVSDELSKLSSVSSELRTFRRQQRSALVRAARGSAAADDDEEPQAAADSFLSREGARGKQRGSGQGPESGAAGFARTSPLFVSVAERHAGGADLMDLAILSSELARLHQESRGDQPPTSRDHRGDEAPE